MGLHLLNLSNELIYGSHHKTKISVREREFLQTEQDPLDIGE
jgi:hypothetical protein